MNAVETTILSQVSLFELLPLIMEYIRPEFYVSKMRLPTHRASTPHANSTALRLLRLPLAAFKS